MKKIRVLMLILFRVCALFLPIQLATAELKATFEGHTDNVWSVAFSPNGKMLASASWDGTVRLWNVNTERLLHTLTEHTDEVSSVAFSPDGKTLASASWDATIRLWNPQNGKLKRTLTEHTAGVASVAFSPDGKTLASASEDQTIRLWDTTTWKLKSVLRGHTHIVDIVAFSPESHILASGSRDTTIRLWDLNNGRTIKTLRGHTGDILRMAFSPDGAVLASGSLDQTVRLWDPNNGKLRKTLAVQTGWVNPVAFSPDGATLVIGESGISAWDTQTGEYKRPLAGDIGGALSVVYSPDGRMVASGSEDNKVRLWEYDPSDYEIPSITMNAMVRLVYFLPSDRQYRPDRMPVLRQLMKDSQQFYANEMERHGFGRKTFTLETDKDGEPVVHRVDGKFAEDYYYEFSGGKIWEEVFEQFDDIQHIYFIAIDVSYESLNGGRAGGLGGFGFFPRGGQSKLFAGKIAFRHTGETSGEEALGGSAIIPASGFGQDNPDFHPLLLTNHELGHTFGLDHDFRKGQEDAVVGGRGFRLSKCAAEWLSVSRFFNTKSTFRNEIGEIQLLSMRTYNQDSISLRFKVTDPDGLHQAQLLLPEITGNTGEGPYRLFDCKQLNGKTSTIESAVRTAELADRVTLQIMDMKGNASWATFLIELDETVAAQNVLDVNGDGVMNLLDLTYLGARFGQRGQNSADVNEDKVVNITDVLLVAAGMSSVSRQAVENFSAADVQKWLTDVKQSAVENEFEKKGVFFLEYLLREIALSSKSTKTVTGALKAIFEGHTDFVWSVAFSLDGQTLASASEDGKIRLWNPQTLRHETTLIGHSSGVPSIVFSPDGQTLVSGSWDRTIRLWNPSTGQLKTTFSGYNIEGLVSVAFSPDGQILAGGSDSSQGEYVIHLWAPKTGEYKTNLVGHGDQVRSIAFSPDGQTLASGSLDRTVRLWDTTTWKLKRTLFGHTQFVESVAFSPDGQTLASGSWDSTVRLWNPNNGKLKKTLTGYTDWVSPLAFSPDGEILAGSSQDQRIRLWNTKTGEYKNTLQEGAGRIMSLAFSPDGEMLASGNENGIVRLWDVQKLLDQSPTPQVLMARSQRPPMYWVDAGTLHRLVDAKVENLVPSVQNATSLAVDMAKGKLYWTEKTSDKTGEIRRVNLDGNPNVQLVKDLTSVPRGIAIDTANDKLYLTNARGKIQRLDIDGSNFQSNLITGLKSPKHLTLDAAGGRIYWTEQTGDTTGKIRHANLNGSNVQLVKSLTSAPRGLAFDPVNRKLYLTNAWGKVQRLNVDGSNFQPNLITDLDAPKEVSVDVVGRKLYWTEQDSIRRADLIGENIEDVVTGLEAPTGIVLGNMPAAARAASAIVERPPDATVLLANYPNPFNPETWIPYQLAEPATVRVTIYDSQGRVVRALELGHQRAGMYHDKSRAAYWDGRNVVGERVASGVYFYTLTAGDFTATRRMLIRK